MWLDKRPLDSVVAGGAGRCGWYDVNGGDTRANVK